MTNFITVFNISAFALTLLTAIGFVLAIRLRIKSKPLKNEVNSGNNILKEEDHGFDTREVLESRNSLDGLRPPAGMRIIKGEKLDTKCKSDKFPIELPRKTVGKTT